MGLIRWIRCSVHERGRSERVFVSLKGYNFINTIWAWPAGRCWRARVPLPKRVLVVLAPRHSLAPFSCQPSRLFETLDISSPFASTEYLCLRAHHLHIGGSACSACSPGTYGGSTGPCREPLFELVRAHQLCGAKGRTLSISGFLVL